MRTPATTVDVAQGAAGTTTVYTPAAGNRVYVTALELSLDATGTLKFTETAGDIAGPWNIAGNQPFGLADEGDAPLFFTSTAGEALKITTVTGKAAGFVTLFEAP